jgi:cardiolipin synthase A/B
MVGMKIDLTVDGDEFWPRLQQDIEGARESVRVQTLSMEGDAAGLGLADTLLDCRATDRRLLIDSYTRYVLSDRLLFSPGNRSDPVLQQEAARTRQMLDDLRAGGVGVQFTNPPGPLLHRFAARDHKKLALIDDRIAYLGGINFSEHNFAWHDMMFRFEDAALARFLAEDFDATWSGRNQSRTATFGAVEVHLLNGHASADSFETIFRAIDSAEREIHVHSPYLSFPFVERLAEARRRGVQVHIITPDRNNYTTLKNYLLWKATEGGMTVWLYPERMMHLKAMLIDDHTLIIGSANFDWLSFAFCQEVVALIRDAGAIDLFRTRILEPDLRQSTRFTGPARPLRGRLAELQLRAASRLMAAAARL